MPRKIEESSLPGLRIANNGDCEKVTALVYGVLVEYGLKPDPEATDADIRDIESSYFKRGGAFFVLEEDDSSVIGAYGLYRLDAQTCELRKMYLHKARRASFAKCTCTRRIGAED